MRAVVQRVSSARVEVAGEVVGAISKGLVVLVGAASDDTDRDAASLARKIGGLRVFEDAAGRMNLDVAQVGGQVLAVSQFTLLGDCRRGRRPSFAKAARPEIAEPLFDAFVQHTRALGLPCETGRFRTTMTVHLVNEGPVTLLVDTRRAF